MKKIFTAFAALVLGSTATFAQFENPFVAFSPEGGHIESRNTVIKIAPTTFGLSIAPNAAGLLVQTVAGQGFSQFPMEPVYYPFSNQGNKEVMVELTDASWFLPFFGVYHLKMFAALADANGSPIINDDLDGYVMGITAYTTPDNDPAVWALNYPSERNLTQEGLTFKRFYEAGVCTFYFTKEVSLPEYGYIVYTDKTGYVEEVSVENYGADWDSDLGLYGITVNIVNPEFTLDNLASIEVGLEGVENAEGQEINVPAIYVENTSSSPQAAPRKSKSLEEGLVSGNETVNVYNVQGMLVKENVSSDAVNALPAGMYIVNGKKVLVR